MAAPHKIDTRWFQNQLADRKMSQRKLAAMMGLDPGALSLALNGKRKLTADEVAELARLLHVDVSEVLSRAGAGAPTRAAGVDRLPPEPSGGDVGFESEFMQRWVALGVLLMRNRGPI